MRIVHATLRYPPATGGVETYAQNLVESTRSLEQNRDVRVLTSKLRTHWPIKELSPEVLLDDPPYVQRLHHAALPGIAYPWLQALKYYIGHHKPDILHGYSFWYQPADVAARYAKRHHIPFIFHPMYYENSVRRKLRWQLYKKTIGWQTFAAADIVVVISPYEQKLIEKSGFPVKRFVLLPPGIQPEKYAPPVHNVFTDKNIKGTILLSVGRIAASKGLQEIISALPDMLSHHSNLQLAIVGENFGAKQQLLLLATKLGVAHRVHFLGKLKRSDLLSAYHNATALVHASHYEAFGIVIIEAMASKLPVIAREAAAIPYVVTKKTGLLFKNKSELVLQITNLLSNKKMQEDLKTNGFMHVQKNFSWETNINKLLDVYNELKPNGK
jgi:glycosyltransferase involved in cell wall biosynthesis